MIGVTAHTSVDVSAIVFGGRPRQFFDLARRGDIELHLNEPILADLLRMLREDFD